MPTIRLIAVLNHLGPQARFALAEALDQVAPAREDEDGEGPSQASYLASTLSASLELVKEGAMDVKQAAAFDDIWLKRRGQGLPLELTP